LTQLGGRSFGGGERVVRVGKWVGEGVAWEGGSETLPYFSVR
jgi:hypothetical protein